MTKTMDCQLYKNGEKRIQQFNLIRNCLQAENGRLIRKLSEG